MNACGADTLRDDARIMKELLDKNRQVLVSSRIRRVYRTSQAAGVLASPRFVGIRPQTSDRSLFIFVIVLIIANRVPNKYDEYDKLPHYFFAFPSPHLDALRGDYYAKTIKGIEWIIQG